MRRVAWIVTASIAALAAPAAAQQSPSTADPAVVEAPIPAPSTPPPLDTPYLQYGVAFTTELVASAGKICDSSASCILGSGGGIVARVGRRSAGPWYFGGAYELSKQDPGSLYRFATLQQARFEARWYLQTGYVTSPYATIGGGVCGYGNEWSVDTYGPLAFVGFGMESQLSRRTVVGFAIAYRLLATSRFRDTSEVDRAAGVAQIIGLDLSLEERDPLSGRH
jgi:hypothetical protein